MTRFVLPVILFVLVSTSAFAQGGIWLDADTPASGSLLNSTPLVTAYGTITFNGELRDKDSDAEFDTAGASGNVFDIWNGGQWVQLSFGFDVRSISFIYGGNTGGIKVETLDAHGGVVNSFFQASTNLGQPAGPISLTGTGIRVLRWTDTDTSMVFAPLDNVYVIPECVPEPASALALLSGIGAIGGLMWRRKVS